MAAYASVIDLSSLSEEEGAVFQGAQAFDQAGYAVAIDDVNGDGFGDMMISAPGAGDGGVYIVFGGDYGWFTPTNLGSLGSLGSEIVGSGLGAYAVGSGDINGDGVADMFVGNEAGSGGDGDAYVVFGIEGGPFQPIDVADLDGSNGFRIDGAAALSRLGIALDGAGDINGDGIEDLIVGAYLDDQGATDAGSAYVVYGKADGWDSSLDLGALDGDDGFRLEADIEDGSAGYDVDGAGDVNGDGYDDLLVGAFRSDDGAENLAGATYLVFGGPSQDAEVDLSGLNGSDGVRFDGDDFSAVGDAVSTAGDINGDGYADLIVGAYGTNGTAGGAFVMFGKAGGWSATVELNALRTGGGTTGFALNGVSADAGGDRAGVAVSSAGDWNGDGFDDVIVTAYHADPRGDADAGAAYVVFGKAGGWSQEINLGALNGADGFRLEGVDPGDDLGNSVAAGDVNGDGLSDILVGAPEAEGSKGEAYIVFGQLPGESVNRVGTNIGQAIYGGDFADTLNGQGGNDRLVGGKTGDLLYGGLGDDTLDGGQSNSDTANYAGAQAGVEVDLGIDGEQDTGAMGVDSLIDVENLVGANFADTLTGSEGDNSLTGLGDDDVLNGGDGTDKLFGGAADDVLSGGLGNDTLDGGNGLSDTASYATAGNGVMVDLDLKVVTGEGTDTLLNIEYVTGSDFNDGLSGSAKYNLLSGGKGADTILGAGGADTLEGGGGSDIFLYLDKAESKNAKADTILDLDKGKDLIDLSAIDANGTAAGEGAFVLVGAFTNHRGEIMLSYDAGEDVTSVLIDIGGDGEADMTILLEGDLTDFTGFVL